MEMLQEKKFPTVSSAGGAKFHCDSSWRIPLSCVKCCACAHLDFLSNPSSPKEFEILLLQDLPRYRLFLMVIQQDCCCSLGMYRAIYKSGTIKRS